MRTQLLLPALSLLLTACTEDEFYRYTNYNPDDAANAPRIEEFAAPKGNARLQTWWHWINGNASKAVSYTHLQLPTNSLFWNSAVAVA